MRKTLLHVAIVFFILGVPVAGFHSWASAAVLELETETPYITAQEAASIELSMTLTNSSGSGVPGAAIMIKSGRGTPSPVEDLGGGRYRATLNVPVYPPPRMPGYLVVMAAADLGDETPSAGLVVPVYSNLVVKGNTAPGTVIYAAAGDVILGEVTVTDESGAYELVAPVPPGAGEVMVIPRGKPLRNAKKIRLEAPGEKQVLALAVPDEIFTGKKAVRAVINIFAVSEQGKPETEPLFTLQCDPGDCAAPTATEPGLFQAMYNPPREGIFARGAATVRYGNVSTSVEFSLKAPAPGAVVLTAGQTAASPGDRVAFSIEVLDDDGDPADAAGVDIFIDDTFAGRADRESTGRYSFNYLLQTMPAAGEVTVRAEATPLGENAGSVSSEPVVLKVSKSNIQLRISSSPGIMEAGETAEVRIFASTASGAGISGLNLEIFSTGGTTDDVRDTGGGTYTFDFTAPDDWTETSITIEISAPEAPGSPSVSATISKRTEDSSVASSETETGSETAPESTTETSPETSTETTTGPETSEDTAPEPAQITVDVSRDQLFPGESVTITVHVTDESGAGVPGMHITLNPEAGSVSATTETSEGMHVAVLSVSESAEAGEVGIEATCDCGGRNLGAAAQVTVVTLLPDSLELVADATEIYIGSGTEINFEASVLDRNGTGLEDQAVNISIKDVSSSSHESLTTGPDGTISFSFEPADTEGILEVTATVKDQPFLSETVEIEKRRYDISSLELSAGANPTLADGTTAVEIEVHAVNEAGADAADERINFTIVSGGGRLNADYITTRDDGREYIYYTPDSSCGTAEIRAYSYRDTTVKKSVSIQKTPAITADLELLQTPPMMVNSGSDTWTLRVKATDAGGCVMEGETVSFLVASGDGTVTASAETDADGIASAKFTSGNTPETVTVTAQPQTAPAVVLATEITVTQVTGFEIVPSASSVSAGQQLTITVTAKNSAGETVERYDATGRTFSVSGPADAPDGTAPSYPSSGTIAAAFTSGAASLQATLYMAETTTITVSDSSVSGTSASITVGAAAASVISIVDGDEQTAIATTAVSSSLIVQVVDSYGNPVQGETVTFSVSSGGGNVTGASRVTAADGTVNPSAWTMGATTGTNELTASIAAGSVSSVTFTALSIFSAPSAVITNESATTSIHVGDSLDFSGAGSSAGTNASITSYSWDFDDDAAEDDNVVDPAAFTYNTTGIYSVSLTVTNDFGESDTALTTIQVNALPAPTAVITNQTGASTIYETESVDFSGTGSTAGSGATLDTYSWDFNDDSVEDDNVADPGAETYNVAGNYLVSFTVTNSYAQTDTATTTIKVLAAGNPISVITNETGTGYICPDDSVDFSGTSSSTPGGTSITSYSWDLDGDSGEDDASVNPAAFTYNTPGNFTVSFTVENDLANTDTSTTTVYVADRGSLALTPNPAAINANGADTAIVTSNTITGCGGENITDGTLFTVATTLGTVTDTDADGGTDGTQVTSSGGTISFTVQAGTASGTANVVVESVDGNYSSFTSIDMIGEDETRPFVVDFSPSGPVTGNVTRVTVKFSENMKESLVTNQAKFQVQREKENGQFENISGSRAYDSGSFTVTFTFDGGPYDVTTEHVKVTLSKGVTDLANNKLDGEFNNTDSAFVFHFGGNWTACANPAVSVCSAAPSPFSPDSSDVLPDTTDITFTSTDDYYLKYWRVQILDGTDVIRTSFETNAGCCEADCAEESAACATCCAANPCCTSKNGVYSWDGRNESGEYVENGNFSCQVTAYDIAYCYNDPPCSDTVEVANPIDFGGYGP